MDRRDQGLLDMIRASGIILHSSTSKKNDLYIEARRIFLLFCQAFLLKKAKKSEDISPLIEIKLLLWKQGVPLSK